MSADRIEQIRERLAKATPGPWIGDVHSGPHCWYIVDPSSWSDDEGMIGDGVGLANREADAELIANAPDDIEFLLSRVDDLTAALRELIEDYDVATRDWKGMEGDGADITIAAARRVLREAS